MSYTALEQMCIKNKSCFQISYPAVPDPLSAAPGSLVYCSLDFLRNRCEGLCFDSKKTALDDFDGSSVKPGQIPFNMEKDIDRLCLENALRRFLESGDRQDAFDVYFCYMEMFLGSYGKTRKMIELLAEFESGAGALLMKHRDHYSHSVYVFALGLALFDSDEAFRQTYEKFYDLPKEAAACHFLRFWGLTSLFHDIGYPFELPFEEIKSYFGSSTKDVPFLAYRGMPSYIRLTDAEAAWFSGLLHETLPEKSINGVLACAIEKRLGSRYAVKAETLCSDILNREASEPEHFRGYMDHAYFSVILLFRKLMEISGTESFLPETLDCFSAIELHNSIFKYNIRQKYGPLPVELHPLAWLLMLCDELQCWDRTAYGQNSRQALYPMRCQFQFKGSAIQASYQYDQELEYKRDMAGGTYQKMSGDNPEYINDLGKNIALNQPGTLSLQISAGFVKNLRTGKQYLSNSSFLHLYQFAAALNARYSYGSENTESREQMELDFESLSLEYKLSNLLQAKSFARYLDAIDCFYTDRPAAYPLLEQFSQADMDVIGPMEHTRWLDEKRSMCWTFGREYLKMTDSKRIRELTRTHCLMIEDYDALSKEEQDKDTEPMNCMLHLIREFDGLRIYRL